MRALLLLVAVAACDSSDNRVEGTHAQCAYGGTLADCPEAERTSEGACWRLVDCGAIPLEDEMGFDWGTCVDFVEAQTADRQRLLVQCIAISSCDELRIGDHCNFGDR